MRHPKLSSKIHSLKSLAPHLMGWHGEGKKIVFTNGCFDIVHRGHVHYLSEASTLGDVLLVGVNSDASVRRLGKGPERPIQDELTRASVLAAFGFIDAVLIFDEDTPTQLIQEIKPHILVKGSDWKGKPVAGEEILKATGGQLVFMDVVQGFSTTNIVKKIKKEV